MTEERSYWDWLFICSALLRQAMPPAQEFEEVGEDTSEHIWEIRSKEALK